MVGYSIECWFLGKMSYRNLCWFQDMCRSVYCLWWSWGTDLLVEDIVWFVIWFHGYEFCEIVKIVIIRWSIYQFFYILLGVHCSHLSSQNALYIFQRYSSHRRKTGWQVAPNGLGRSKLIEGLHHYCIFLTPSWRSWASSLAFTSSHYVVLKG